jgi:hypothetical protein
VSDQLLRLHFRQSVLANMRGAGEPVFEHDFPPGTDMLPWSVFSHVILPSTLAAKNNANGGINLIFFGLAAQDIREGPMAQEIFELELFSRLREDV